MEVTQCDKGTLKKLSKKLSKGSIATAKDYYRCLKVGLHQKARTQVSYEQNAKTQKEYLNPQDIQEVIQSLAAETAVPRGFSFMNKGFIRRVVYLHLSNCTDTDVESGPLLLLQGKGIKSWIRSSKGKTTASLPDKIMSVSVNADAEAATAAKTQKEPAKLEAYMLPEGLMDLWGYPQPITSTQDTFSDSLEQTPKRRRIDEQNEVHGTNTSLQGSAVGSSSRSSCHDSILDSRGVLLGTVPTQQEATEVLAALTPVRVRNGKLRRKKPSGTEGAVEGDKETTATTGTGEGATTETTLASSSSSSSSSSTTRTEPEEDWYLQTQPARDSDLHARLWQSSGKTAAKAIPGAAVAVQPRAVLAIDCEMCETAQGTALTRLSVLCGSTGQVLLDTLVLPSTPIVDYKTQWSGITAAAMKGVTVTAAQARLSLLRLCSAETLLVGHSLENDLHALQLVHLRCVDTAYLFPHPRGFPLRRKLSTIAREYLQLRIPGAPGAPAAAHTNANTNTADPTANLTESAPAQASAGHDSVADARAALLLALEKAARGPSYGLQRGHRLRVPLADAIRALPSFHILQNSMDPYRDCADSNTNTDSSSVFESELESFLCEKFCFGCESSRTAMMSCVGRFASVCVCVAAEEKEEKEAKEEEAVSTIHPTPAPGPPAPSGDTTTGATIPAQQGQQGQQGQQAVRATRRLQFQLEFRDADCATGLGTAVSTMRAIEEDAAAFARACTQQADGASGTLGTVTAAGAGAGAGAAGAGAPRQTLVIVSAQRSLSIVDALQRQKAACAKAMTAATWSATQEAQLESEVKRVNLCSLVFTVV